MSAGALSNSEQNNQGRKSIPGVFMEGRIKQFSSENNQKSNQGHVVEKKNPLERSHEDVEMWLTYNQTIIRVRCLSNSHVSTAKPKLTAIPHL